MTARIIQSKALAARTISLTKLNERTIVQTVKRNGKVVRVHYMTVSADGETASLKTENKEQGQTCTVTATKQQRMIGWQHATAIERPSVRELWQFDH